MPPGEDIDAEAPSASHSEFDLLVPQGTVDAVAERLALRGHRWVIVRGDGVESLCVNPPPTPSDPGGRWQDCETAAVEAIAREHTGYLGSGLEGGGGAPERHFLRGGRVATIELDAETALERRRTAIAAFPAQRPEPPGAWPFDDDAREGGDFLAAIREGSQRAYGDPQAAFKLAIPYGQDERWLPASAGEFLSELFNAVMHQDSCYPHTAEAVPLIVALAVDDRLPDSARALAYGMLWSGASSGQRLIAYLADKLVAEGDGFELWEGPRLTRLAIEAEVGGLFERWDGEPGSVRLMLAGLAAVFPRQAAASPGLLPGLTVFAERWEGTHRGAALRLALAAARADDPDTLARLAAIQAWHWQGPLAGGSPLAPAQYRALHLLDEMLDAD